MAVIEEIIEEKVVASKLLIDKTTFVLVYWQHYLITIAVPEIPPVKVEKEETDVPEPDEDGDVFYDCVDYQAEELEVNRLRKIKDGEPTGWPFTFTLFYCIETDKRGNRIQVKRQHIFCSKRV